MARPSKLTDAQWEKIGKRLLADESASSLAREYGISKTAISLRFSKRNETVKTVANQLVAAENGMASLNVSEQIAARTLADELKAVSMHLASAARYSASTAHRLSGIANARAAFIPDTGELDEKGKSEMLMVAALQKMSNDAFEPGVKLLNANKEFVGEQRQRDREAQVSEKEFKASSSAEAAVLYQQMIGSGS